MKMDSSSILNFEQRQAIGGGNQWIILIHGAGGSIRTWKKQVDDLVQWFNLVIVDLPGHGSSRHITIDANSYNFEWLGEKVWQVVDHLQLKNVHVMGVSLGSIIAMQMKALRPLEVSSLIMAGAIVRLDFKMRTVAQGCLGLAKVIGYPAFYRLAAKILLPKKNHKKSRDIFIRESKYLTNEEFGKWTSMYGYYLNSTLKKLFEYKSMIPTLCVMGAQDHMFLKEAKKYVTKHSFAHIEIIKRSGHLSNLEQPKIFNEICRKFISE